jgi:hypothetical protein
VDFHRIGLASAAVIVADTYLPGYREHVKIMEAVWPLTALYAGPLAHAANVLGGVRCRTSGCGPRPRHARPAVLGRDRGRATDCGAGCVLGDLIAEWALFAAGWLGAGSRTHRPSPAQHAVGGRLGPDACSQTPATPWPGWSSPVLAGGAPPAARARAWQAM